MYTVGILEIDSVSVDPDVNPVGDFATYLRQVSSELIQNSLNNTRRNVMIVCFGIKYWWESILYKSRCYQLTDDKTVTR